MTTYAVTAGSSNAAVGNAAVTGNFNANTLTVGNTTVNTTIRTANSVQQSNGQYFLNANGNWSLVAAPTYSDFYNTSGNTTQIIDFYEMATYNTVEYLLSIVDNNANNRLTTKLLTTHDMNIVTSLEYASILSNNAIGAFVANANSTHVKLNFTPSSTNTTVKFIRFNI
jgi:hypothetical protein